MEPLLMIINAEAGSSQEQTLKLALDVLREKCDVEVCATSNPGELDGVLHRAGSRTIVVAGGDGSLHAVVAALHKRHELGRSTLALLPLGTGNDFARSLGIPLEPAEAARAIVEGTPRSMDLIVDELGEVVVNGVHVGASANASRKAAQWKGRLGKVGLGIFGYPIGTAISAVRPDLLRLHVEVDGEIVADMDHHVLMVALGNGTSVGGGTELTPDAQSDDGEIDVMVSSSIGQLTRLAYVWDLVRGAHRHRRDVHYLRGREVSVAGEDFWMSADGEISGPERRRTWHVEPDAYRMVVPPTGHQEQRDPKEAQDPAVAAAKDAGEDDD